MRLAMCLAFASHLGAPLAFYTNHRNIIQGESAIRDVFCNGDRTSDICNAADIWDHEGTAFVKVNLSLQVDPLSDPSQPLLKLVTFMQKVLWGDHVSIRTLNEKEAQILSESFETTSDGDVLLMIDEIKQGQPLNRDVPFPFDETNLIARALNTVRNDNQRFLVLTRKRVLPGSGLGGGSADAAFVLRCLGKNISQDKCLSLGSDVSFMASDANVAVVSGVGEKITPMMDLDYASHVHILVPDEAVSTKEVFTTVRERLRQGNFDPGPMPISVDATCKSASRFSQFRLFNALEQCVNKPKIKHLSQILRDRAPPNSFCMSGSGCSFILLGLEDEDVLRIREHYGQPLLIVKTRFKKLTDCEAQFTYL